MEFTALQDFYSPELKSQYTKDLSYNARDPDDPALKVSFSPTTLQRLASLFTGTVVPTREQLAILSPKEKRAALAMKNRATLRKLLPQWVKEGKVVMGSPARAQVIGEG